MTILDELLEGVKKLEVDEQLRIICDRIIKEEIPKPDEYEGPNGSNMWLSLPFEIPHDTKYENYLCLEREVAGVYIISHWSCLSRLTTSTPKRVKVWDIKYTDAKRILKEFAERMQFLKGE